MRDSEKKELCTLIYYPEQKIELVKQQEPDLNDWYQITLLQLVKVCREVSSKYSRSKVRKSLPADFGYIIEELLHESTDDIDKQAYVSSIITSIIRATRTLLPNTLLLFFFSMIHVLVLYSHTHSLPFLQVRVCC
jgi:fructose-1,6-bisphosphatase-3